MKKTILIIISFFCVLSMSLIDIQAEEYNDFEYYTNYNNELVISGYVGNDPDIVIPEEIDGISVNAISNLFTVDNLDKINSITIPKNISSFDSGYLMVGGFPFMNVKVNEYIVDEENEYFASYDGCLYSKDHTAIIRCPNNRNEIEYPSNVTTIKEGAYSNTDFTTIMIPETITTIESNYDHGYLGGCDVLEEIIVESGNQNYQVLNDALYRINNGEMALIRYPNSKTIDNYVISQGTTMIDWNAFEGNNIKSVTFPTTMSSIGANAFMNCTSLEIVTIPDNITYLEYSAFNNCTNLVNVDMGNGVTEIEMYVFAGCSKLENVKISSNLSILESGTFNSCTSLKEVVIPEGVQAINGWAFNNCPNLISVTIPKSVTYMENLFVECPNVIMNVYEGSYALEYAIENDINYQIISDVLLGDVNGDSLISYNDAVLILQSDSKIITLDATQLMAANVNGDDVVDYNDAVQILRKDAGLIEEF